MLRHLMRAAEARRRSVLATVRREDGQTMAEYAVILAVIVIAALVALQLLGGGIDNALRKIVAVLRRPRLTQNRRGQAIRPPPPQPAVGSTCASSEI